MALINAVIESNGKNLVIGFPCKIYNAYSELQAIGIQKPPYRIRLTDNEEDGVCIKLWADSDIGKHMLPLLTEQHSLEDANNAAFLVTDANELIADDLEQNLLYDQYGTLEELYQDIRQMIYDAGAVSETFYFPLTGNIFEGEYGDIYTVGNSFLAAHENEISEALERYMERDINNMAKYYDKAGRDKLLSADWSVVYRNGLLLGKVDVRLTESMTAEEKEELKDWISGQNSDGAGEGFEQQDIDTEDGTLNVSFWHSGNDYYICTEDELEGCIEAARKDLQLGGI